MSSFVDAADAVAVAFVGILGGSIFSMINMCIEDEGRSSVVGRTILSPAMTSTNNILEHNLFKICFRLVGGYLLKM